MHGRYIWGVGTRATAHKEVRGQMQRSRLLLHPYVDSQDQTQVARRVPSAFTVQIISPAPNMYYKLVSLCSSKPVLRPGKKQNHEVKRQVRIAMLNSVLCLRIYLKRFTESATCSGEVIQSTWSTIFLKVKKFERVSLKS